MKREDIPQAVKHGGSVLHLTGFNPMGEGYAADYKTADGDIMPKSVSVQFIDMNQLNLQFMQMGVEKVMTPQEVQRLTPEGYGGDFEPTCQTGGGDE